MAAGEGNIQPLGNGQLTLGAQGHSYSAMLVRWFSVVVWIMNIIDLACRLWCIGIMTFKYTSIRRSCFLDSLSWSVSSDPQTPRLALAQLLTSRDLTIYTGTDAMIQPKVNILTIASEIRLMILECLLIQRNPINPTLPFFVKERLNQPYRKHEATLGLVRTCRQLYGEGNCVYFGGNTFSFFSKSTPLEVGHFA
jgi:hypothetical protein